MGRKRLLRRIFLPYLWITVTVVVVVGLYASYAMRHFYLDQTAEDLEARARLSAKEILKLLEQGETDAVDGVCKDWGKSINTRITAILPSGEVIGDTDEHPRHMENHNSRPEVQEALRGLVGRQTHYSKTLKEERMYVAVAAGGEGGSPAVVVRTSIPVTAIHQTMAVMHHKILVAGLAAMGAIVAVSLWISLRIARPLQQMKTAAQRFAQGDLEQPLPESGTEELDELAEALNRMAEQLDERLHSAER
jgi:two-component system phosphate regulon sensor histidine kinase PhoR